VFWTYFDPKGCQFNLWDNHGVTADICGVGGILSGKQMLTHRYCTPSFDQAFPALLEDLAARGLLDETLVVVAGDFGRTPKINNMSGRDHWASCYTQLLAGGGVRGGQVYGASDRIGAYVKDRPVTPEDFHATILHAMGVSPDATIRDPLDRPIRVSEGTPLVELF
jgi:arylsulfatase A-like enzyme